MTLFSIRARTARLWARSTRAVGLASLCLALSACGSVPRVSLQAPNAKSDPQSRLSAFEGLRPVTQITHHSQEYGEINQLELANKVLVTDPRDLLTVVPPNSATAQAAHRYATHRRRARSWRIARYVTGFGTLSCLALSLNESRRRPMLLGAGAFALATLVSQFFAIVENRNQSLASGTAFKTYPKDLLDHLGLKVRVNGPKVRQKGGGLGPDEPSIAAFEPNPLKPPRLVPSPSLNLGERPTQ